MPSLNLTHNRQIRALYDETTITVYQAYNSAIAEAAVKEQRLDASPLFKPARMTWIKPSWNWMMYRSGYSYKDSNQSNVLAIKLTREFFHELLLASVESGSDEARRDGKQARVQWDPERNVRIRILGNNTNGRSVRSIQIGIPAALKDEWVSSGIVEIEDATERARELKRVLDLEKDVSEDELKSRGLMPFERVYELTRELAEIVEVTNE